VEVTEQETIAHLDAVRTMLLRTSSKTPEHVVPSTSLELAALELAEVVQTAKPRQLRLTSHGRQAIMSALGRLGYELPDWLD
jgi:hypothetical protein